MGASAGDGHEADEHMLRCQNVKGVVRLTEQTPVLEETSHADDLLMWLRGGLELDNCAIGSDDLVGGQNQECRGHTDEDDDQESLRTGGENPLGRRMSNSVLTRYVDVDTAERPPDLMLMARAMMDPMKDPNWKIAQKIANALPLSFSSGYDIIIAPCADHRSAAVAPRIAPARIRNQAVCCVW